MKMVKKMRMYEWFEKTASNYPKKTAINFKDKNWKYGQLYIAIKETASFLQIFCNLSEGDRVAYYGSNNVEILILILAASKIGLIVVPINWRLATPEIKYLINNSSPKLIIFDPKFSKKFKQFFDNKIYAIPITDDDTFGLSLNKRRKNYSESSDVVKNDLDLLLVYTSGTTGQPKGAVLSQKSVVCNALMSHHAHSMTVDDNVFVCLPMFHVGGINILSLPSLFKGATLFLDDKFDADEVLSLIREKSISHIITVPTILYQLLRSKIWKFADLKSLKNISVGSTDVPVKLINEIHKKNIPAIQIYGATETSPLAIYQTSEMAFSSVGSIGKEGIHCSIKLVDEKLQKVNEGESGEILVKGDNILSYYWKDEIATKSNLIEGWFRTGDIARVDKNGFYWFLDRIKNVIISGGENIYPAELERILKNLKGIPEFCIVGKLDDYWGEVPVVVIKKKNNPYSKEEIISFFSDKVARFKIPKNVFFLDNIPKNVLGKILVNEVKTIIQRIN